MIGSNYSAEDVDGEDMQDRERAKARDGAEECLAEEYLPRVFVIAIRWIEGNLNGLGFRSRWMK